MPYLIDGDWIYEFNSLKEVIKFRIAQFLGIMMGLGIIAIIIYIMSL